MSETIHKSHNISVLTYHFICPAKSRRAIMDEEVERVINEMCEEIQKRYEIRFLKADMDKDNLPFTIQSVLTISPKKNIQIVKSIIAGKVQNINK